MKHLINRYVIVFCFAFLISDGLKAAIVPTGLLCEYAHNPMAIDVLKPRLSWINSCKDNTRGQIQTAYEIVAAETREKLLAGAGNLWKSGKVKSGESVNVLYEGRTPGSGQDCWWRVRVWDKDGAVSEWSEPAFFSMGMLSKSDWKATWIGAPWQNESPVYRNKTDLVQDEKSGSYVVTPPPAPYLRKSFNVSKQIASARAYVSGLGLFEMYINGKKVGDDVLTPNLSLYDKRADLGELGVMINNNFREYRVMYLAYDIKKYLKQGDNAAGVLLGNGFYNPGSRWTMGYGSPRFLGQIRITYTDGTEELITSDTTWKVAKSPILMDLIYEGEQYDARLEQTGWSEPGFDDNSWVNAIKRKTPEGRMTAQLSPVDRVMEKLAAKKIEKTKDGHYLVDFGEEISGWIHLFNITGEKGRKIEIRYICESPNGSNSYILKGSGKESYAARFTWFVFRQAEIINWPGELKSENLIAEAVYSNIGTTGHFECSNALFNNINRIWWRSQTDNMHCGVASDCPHRERAPYTGDGQVSCITVMHNFDARTFYTKWIQDMLGAQNPDNGYVPNGAPWQPGCGGGVAWGAAINIMPWEFYLHYGDMDMLRRNFEGMKGYIKYMLTWVDDKGIMFAKAPDAKKPIYWLNLGDWCTPGEMPPDDMVHTFYLWRCSDLTARTAEALGEKNDALTYRNLAERTKKAFQEKFYDESKGSYGPRGGNIFALKMGVPENQLPKVIAALKSDIEANGGHLDTGIFGTQFFFEVLADYGLNELAYTAMNQKTQPGYGWWISQGATTTWERWDGKDSRNHPMFGGGIVWFYRKLAGMNADPENPGYRNIIFKPQPVNDISYAKYSNMTRYGEAGISWKKENGKFVMEIDVPVGSTATVYVPASDSGKVTESGKPVKKDGIITFLRIEKGYAVYTVASGKYRFES
jgi:alpha-L-rhamnosidase